MAKSKSRTPVRKTPAKTRPIVAGRPMVAAAFAEDTGAFQIRLFLSKVIPLRGCCYGDDAEFLWGRSLIEGLALAHDSNAEHEWDLQECAAVIKFLNSIEPIKNGVCFCDGDTLTCGHQAILDAIYDDMLRISAGAGPRRKQRAA